MKKLLILTIFSLSMLSMGTAQSAQQGQAATAKTDHREHMQALLKDVNTTWNEVQAATRPEAKQAAMKSHAQALNALNAAHDKMAANDDHDMMNMCHEMMEKHKQGNGEHSHDHK